MAFTLRSSAFADGENIPSEYTCEGANVSPELTWAGPPERTRSFALVVDDPDAPDPQAPRVRWVHWVLYNLPAELLRLPKGVDTLPTGTLQGINDWKRTGWSGPCPPVGEHRYVFTLYALDTMLEDLSRPTRNQLERVVGPHLVGRAMLLGMYQKRASR